MTWKIEPRHVGPDYSEVPHTGEGRLSIDLHKAFEVRRPVGEVWSFLTDPRSIAGCMPGAHLFDVEDGRFVGEVELKLGPFGTTLAGHAGFQEMDVGRHSVLMAGSAAETTGDGTADLRMRSRLSQRDGPVTEVDLRLGVRLDGRLAGPIVSRLLSGAAELLLRRFVSCVRARLEDTGGAVAS